MIRPAVIDTNILVAGILTSDPDAPTVRIVDGMCAGAFPFLLSLDLVTEYRDVLLRPAISARHGLKEGQIDAILTELAANAIIREPTGVVGDQGPDPGDAHLWSLLAEDPRAVLVTGDKRLLAEPPEWASVVTAQAFLALREDDSGKV